MKEFFKSFAESSSKVQLFTVVMTLFFLFYCACNAGAETRRVGNNFVQVSAGSKADTLMTSYTYEIKEVKHPIIINMASGACYIWKKSSKTGKMYKMYLNDEITNAICKELGVERKKRSK